MLALMQYKFQVLNILFMDMIIITFVLTTTKLFHKYVVYFCTNY